MTLEQHLAWLLHLMSEYPEGWRHYVWSRAKELAKRPELADLPRLLTAALQSSASTPSGESKPKPATLPATTARP
jgi:hypothetical protein